MDKRQKISAIVWNPDINSVLVYQLADETYSLPLITTKLGADTIKEIKSEVEAEYKVKIKFLRSLPDSWYKLVNMHAKIQKVFHLYYIFGIVSEPASDFKYNWLEISDLAVVELNEYDVAALEIFKELYDIIETS